MKYLKDYINESINEASILNDIDKTLDDAGLKQLIIKYISENYFSRKNQYNWDLLSFNGKNSDGKFIVDFPSDLQLIKDVPFTNDLFVWGKVERFVCSIESNYVKTLKSFKGAGLPMHVDDDLKLSDFKSVTDLEGLPIEVAGNCDIYGFTKLKSLKGIPNHVGKMLFIILCNSLNELDCLPTIVGGGITINHNRNLEYITGLSNITSVNGSLFLNNNFKLKSLKGCPSTVNGDFNIDKCKELASLEGCPSSVAGSFFCKNCGTRFTKSDVAELCNVGKNINAYTS